MTAGEFVAKRSAARPVRPSLAESSTPARVASAIFLAVALDWQDFWRFGPSWRYFALLVLLLGVVYVFPSRGRRVNTVIPKTLLIAFVISASMAATSLMHGQAIGDTFVIWLPMLILFVAAMRPVDLTGSAEADVRLLELSVLGYISLSFANFWWSSENSLSTHESFFPLIAMAAFMLRSRYWALASVALSTVALGFWRYPAATFIIATFIALVWGMTLRAHTVRAQVGLLLAAVCGTLAASRASELLSGYFQVAGKGNNLSTRQLLLQEGIDQWLQNPWVGNVMAGTFTVQANIRGAPTAIPTHNGLLSLAISGGVLLLVSMLAVWLVGLRNAHQVATASMGYQGRRRIGLLSGSGIAIGLSVMLFNPIIESLNSSMLLYAFLALTFGAVREAEDSNAT